MKIAALMTCHNRKEKTLSCLRTLFEALDSYNAKASVPIALTTYISDDGCTDGTADAVMLEFADKPIDIFQGDGNLFWAGGMRYCWNEALKRHQEWDYYLLLNDDVDILPHAFDELLRTNKYCIETYNKVGIYSGITYAKNDQSTVTYGGDVWANRFLGTTRRLGVSDKPQECIMTNANILLVPRAIVDAIGIFYKGYSHSRADNDYTYRAYKKGIPILITAKGCGFCDNDHIDKKVVAKKIMSMTLAQRKNYFCSPLHSSNDYLKFIWRITPLRYPIALCGRLLNLYCPSFYYFLDRIHKL